MVNYPNIKVIENIEDLKGKTIKDTYRENNFYVLTTLDKECIEIKDESTYEDTYIAIEQRLNLEDKLFRCTTTGTVNSYLEDLEEINTDTIEYENLIQFLIRNEVINKEEYTNYLNERKLELLLEKQKTDKINEDKEYKEYLRLKAKYDKN